MCAIVDLFHGRDIDIEVEVSLRELASATTEGAAKLLVAQQATQRLGQSLMVRRGDEKPADSVFHRFVHALHVERNNGHAGRLGLHRRHTERL